MFIHAASYITGYLLVLCTLVALLLVIPEASAASNRLKPGWRAWVWPLAFLGLLLKNGTEATALVQNLDSASFLWQFGDMAACFSLTMLVLNSVYRTLDDTGAHRVTLLTWLLYFLFALAIFWLSSFPVLLIYEVLSAVGLAVFYARLYLNEREQATDALPVVAGVSLLLFSTLLYLFSFEISLGFVGLNQIIIGHLLQVVGVFFLYKGASNSYSVKYAAQRRRERNHPALNQKA